MPLFWQSGQYLYTDPCTLLFYPYAANSQSSFGLYLYKVQNASADVLGWEDIIGHIYCTSKVAWTVNDYHWNSRRSACQELIFLFYLNTCRGISEGKNYFLETAVLICCVDLNSSLFLYSRNLHLRAPPCFWHLQFVISQCGWEGGSWKNIGIDL